MSVDSLNINVKRTGVDQINGLIALISKEAELFESFLHELESQRKALVANDVDYLTGCTARQQELLTASRELALERELVVAQISDSYNMTGDLTVSRLLKLASYQQAEQLVSLRELILSLNDQIADVRNANAMLINQSRQFISETMLALSRLNSPPANYNANVQTDSETNHAVALDRRV